MEKDISNKILVITGGARGIGFEFANYFLKNKLKLVILLDTNENNGNEATSKLNAVYGENSAVFIKCDVTKDLDEVFQKIIKEYTYVDILINNAGVLADHNIKLSVAVNVTALMEFTMKFWNLMRTDKGGRGGTIINISSIYGYRKNVFNPIYQGTKYAVKGFSTSLGDSYNYNRSGVRVLTICPGFTHTLMASDVKTPEEIQLDHDKFAQGHDWQQAESLGRGAVKVFENADSGTVWVIEGGRDPEEVTV